MALDFGGGKGVFGFKQSSRASQGLEKPKRLDTASVVVAIDESGDFQDISEAIKSLDESGGYIQLKEGIFTTKTTISVPSNVTIRGTGYNTLIKISSTNEVFENEDLTLGNENIEISDLRIEANGDDAIRLKNCTSCDIKNIKIQTIPGVGANYGILIEDSTKILIERCTTLDTGLGYGLQLSGVTFSNFIKNHAFGENVSINLINCDNCIFTNNQCNDAGDIGISIDDDSSLCNFANNNVSNSANIGIDNYGSYCIIHGNICNGASTKGIYNNTASDNCIITENMGTVQTGGTANIITNNKNI